jgi:hypothetical protein
VLVDVTVHDGTDHHRRRLARPSPHPARVQARMTASDFGYSFNVMTTSPLMDHALHSRHAPSLRRDGDSSASTAGKFAYDCVGRRGGV